VIRSIGVIGVGVMGAVHARLLVHDTPGGRLAAVYDADEKKAASFGVKTFDDPLSLIRSDDIDGIVIASPDSTHADYVLAAIAEGKPVLCEKPIAATAAEALRIIEAEITCGRRLVQVGFMRRFDAGYQDLRQARIDRSVGKAQILHNVHRNKTAPSWFHGAMVITNAFVHEIDISQWLLNSAVCSAQIITVGLDGPLMITMQTERDEVIATEVNMNCGYGYHVHAQLVGSAGTIEMAPPARTLLNQDGSQRFGFPADWIPRFITAYRDQMNAWVMSHASGIPVGASAWEGYTTTLIADQLVEALAGSKRASLTLPERPEFYGRIS
jgi:myo-inositol 2-dehydrogenase/D-chiro-inositol 1-dehydrogenase